MLIAVGRYEPFVPSGARISVIAGTRAWAPISPASASIRFPTRQPMTIATSAVGSESAGTRIAPATMTSSETPRLPQSRPRSKPAEHAQALRHGIDAPGGSFAVPGASRWAYSASRRRSTYGRIPPWRTYSRSRGVSSRRMAPNSIAVGP